MAQNPPGHRRPTSERSPVWARQRWLIILEKAEQGDHPTPAELAYRIQDLGVPDFAREYVAKRVEDSIHLGDGGSPGKTSLAHLRTFVKHRKAVQRVERRAEAYRRLRLPQAREKAVRPRDAPATAEPERVLRGTVGSADGWARASGRKVRIKQPLRYAARRVALDLGVRASTVLQWKKRLGAEAQELSTMIKKERAALARAREAEKPAEKNLLPRSLRSARPSE